MAARLDVGAEAGRAGRVELGLLLLGELPEDAGRQRRKGGRLLLQDLPTCAGQTTCATERRSACQTRCSQLEMGTCASGGCSVKRGPGLQSAHAQSPETWERASRHMRPRRGQHYTRISAARHELLHGWAATAQRWCIHVIWLVRHACLHLRVSFTGNTQNKQNKCHDTKSSPYNQVIQKIMCLLYTAHRKGNWMSFQLSRLHYHQPDMLSPSRNKIDMPANL